MTVSVPTDKKPLGKVAYIRKFIKKALSADTDINEVQKHTYITLKSKSKRIDNVKKTIKEIMDYDSFTLPKEFDFSSIEVVLDYDIGRNLQSNTKFINILEMQVISFYSALMQYFEKWIPSSPKAESKPVVITPDEDNTELVKE